MWKKIPKEYRRQFNILLFVVLPMLLIFGLVVSTKIVQFIGFTVDARGVAFVSFSFLPLCALYFFSAYSAFKKKKPKNQTANSESDRS